MDFEKLIHIARKNQLKPKEPVKCLQTKFKPPTKEQKEKDKALSDGVQKFLARREYEEKQKKLEAIKKREELEALRAKDPKANKRVQVMIKRTKSANRSVMDDVDANNTADTIAGPIQPDDDDYGFVSESSSALYNNIIKKMYSTPSDDLPKFAPSKKPSGANLMSTKERVKMALLKEEEDERLPHKRKRRRKDGTYAEDDEGLNFSAPDRNVDDVPSRVSEKPKPKRPPAPPPLDFMELLKIAEQKQHEPVVVEPKAKKTEPDQLMTKKQREEHLKMEEWRRQREARLKAQERGETPPEVTTAKPTMKRIPKIGQTSSEPRMAAPPKSSATEKVDIPKIPKGSKSDNTGEEKRRSESNGKSAGRNGILKVGEKPKSSISKPASSGSQISKKTVESETEKLKRERDEALRILKEKEEAYRILEEKERLIRERDEALAKLRLLEEKAKKSVPPKSVPDVKKTAAPKPQGRDVPKNRPEPTKGAPSRDFKRPEPPKASRDFPAKDVRRPEPPKGGREFPPKDLKRPDTSKSVREFPPRDVKGVPKTTNGRPMTKEEIVRRKLAIAREKMKRRRIEDSEEEEYDSELDDFIDDGPDPSLAPEAVSDVIKQIFNYDKNKYSRYDDDDDECMESNWQQITKEEHHSTKCGILEDLEDMEKERQELARKKMKKKR